MDVTIKHANCEMVQRRPQLNLNYKMVCNIWKYDEK